MTTNSKLDDSIRNQILEIGDVMILRKSELISPEIQADTIEEYELCSNKKDWKKVNMILLSYRQNPWISKSYRNPDDRIFTTEEVLNLARGDGYEFI